ERGEDGSPQAHGRYPASGMRSPQADTPTAARAARRCPARTRGTRGVTSLRVQRAAAAGRPRSPVPNPSAAAIVNTFPGLGVEGAGPGQLALGVWYVRIRGQPVF